MLFTAAFFILLAAAAGTGVVRINLFRFGTYTGILLSRLLCVAQQLDGFVGSVAAEAEHAGSIVAGVLQQYGKSAEVTVMKRNRFSKWIVALVILLNALFTGAVLFVFLRVGSEPTTLVAAWFGFTTVELWTLAGITKAKVIQGGEINANPRDRT